MSSSTGQTLASRGALGVAALVLATAMTSCAGGGDHKTAPPAAASTGAALSSCQRFGVTSAPVSLNLQGLRLMSRSTPTGGVGQVPRLAVEAYDALPPDAPVNAAANLFVMRPSGSTQAVRDSMWQASIGESSSWQVDPVAKESIAAQATTLPGVQDARHATFTATGHDTRVTYDYWSFVVHGQRYLLGYSRTARATTAPPQTFVTTALDCTQA